MRYHIKLWLFGIFLFLFLGSVSTIHAQSNAAWVPQCMPITHCNEGTNPNPTKNDACNPINNDAVHQSNSWGHRAQLNLEGLTFGARHTLIVTECIHNANMDITDPPDGIVDIVCTTGNSDLDKSLFCDATNNTNPHCDRFNLLKTKFSYSFDDVTDGYGIFYLNQNGVYERQIAPRALKSDVSGKSDIKRIEWQVHTPLEFPLERSYIVWELQDDNNQQTPTPTGSVGGQQQGTLAFPIIDNPPNTDCPKTGWDPYGRVFDAVSLEPIPGASVLLEQKGNDGVFSGAVASQNNYLIINPFNTVSPGGFVFYVVDGEYKLVPSATGYLHPDKTFPISSAMRKMYSHFYFSDSSPIIQRGSIQHRDIPLKPVDGVGKSYPIEILGEEFMKQDDGNLIYSGKVSHPFLKLEITICSDSSGTSICRAYKVFDTTNGGPDKNGDFKVILNQKDLQNGEYFERKFSKSNAPQATNSMQSAFNFISKIINIDVFAQESITKNAKIQPIPSILEGFAYDFDGNLLPNAKVMVFMTISNKPVFITSADKNGYYKILSDKLPKSAFRIEYESHNNTTNISTSQFLTQNKDYITKENIDIYHKVTTKTDPQKNITPSFVPQQKISPIPITPQATQAVPKISPSPNTDDAKTSRSPVYLVGAIALLLIGGAGVLIALHMYHRRTQDKMDM